MNEFLAEIYNTRQSVGATVQDTEVEKLAEAQLLDEALRAEGVDIDRLPGDTILKLAHEMFGDNSALVKSAAAEKVAEEGEEHEKKESPEFEAGEQEEEKEEKAEEKKAAAPAAAEETFEEKMAQADFLGRQMAHAFWNEKTNIEKTGGARIDKALEHGKKALESFKGFHTRGAESMRKGVRGFTVRDAKAGPAQLREAGKGERVKEFARGAAHFAPHAAGATGIAALAAHKFKSKGKKEEGQKKAASVDALDALAEKRAMAWAEAHGLIQNEPTEEMKLAAAVDERAYEMLKAAGIDVDAIEAAMASQEQE